MNLSCGERPVCSPVRTTNGPSAATRPSADRIASSYSSAVERLARTTRPIPRWDVAATDATPVERAAFEAVEPGAFEAVAPGAFEAAAGRVVDWVMGSKLLRGG